MYSNGIFREYIEARNQMEDLRYKIQMLKESYYGISGINYDEHVHSTTAKSQVARIQEIDEYVEKYEELKEKVDDLYEKYNNMIVSKCDTNQARVLRCYYLLGMKISEISNSMGVTDQHILKVKSQALKQL